MTSFPKYFKSVLDRSYIMVYLYEWIMKWKSISPSTYSTPINGVVYMNKNTDLEYDYCDDLIQDLTTAASSL
jgi:hypothetical protein